MSTNYMITLPRTRESIQAVWLLQWMIDNDIHKWIIAKETGTDGYKHWQIRVQARYTWEEMKKKFGSEAHIEEASDTWTYERKEGEYWSSTDTPGALEQRYAELRPWQKRILEISEKSTDREIVVCHDPAGNHGKSFLIAYLWERGLAHCVQGQNNAKGIVQDCASEFISNGFRPIVVIDIPWTWKWTKDLYVAIERIKDGLIKDTRYGSRTINIHGVQVLVMCNQKPNMKLLAPDRWKLLTICDSEDGPTLLSEPPLT